MNYLATLIVRGEQEEIGIILELKRGIMMNRRLAILFLASVLLFLKANTALAFGFTGTIERIHYNSRVPGRNVCVRTTPTAPGTGWLCLYEQHLTKEINDLLREAYENGRTCSFFWDNTGAGGHASLDIVECYNP